MEDATVIGWHKARLVAAFAMALSSVASTAGAQRNASPTAPKLMVGIFRSADKKLGVDAAEAVRDRIGGDVSLRSLHVIPKQDIVNTLESSGYSTTDALSAADANALAKNTRADDYIEGDAVKTATGFQIEVFLILTRDQYLLQPLGRFEHAKLEGAAAMVSKAFQEAQRVLEPEKKCRQFSREGKTAEALKEVASGLQAYPKSVWMRACQLNVFVDTKRPPEEIIKVAEEIIALDSLSRPALTELVRQYDVVGNKDKKIQILLRLYQADPSNPRLMADVVNELAASGKYEAARPIIERAVGDNPGDVSLIRTYYLILARLNDTKTMARVGEEMVKIDTALADADFFDRQITAYQTDSNYQKAAETAARAAAKFPKDAANWLRLGNLQRRAGQTQQSIASLRRAVEIDPKLKGPRLLIISAYVEQNQFDSAFAAMRDAATAGEDPDIIGSTANILGNRALQAAQKAEPKTAAEFAKVRPYAAFADSVAKDRAIKNNAKFLIGVSAYFMAALTYPDVVKDKSCEGAKTVNNLALEALVNLPIGGATNPGVVQQLMVPTQDLLTASERAIKVLCKAETPGTKKPPGKP